jgi:hypothetical protein
LVEIVAESIGAATSASAGRGLHDGALAQAA